YANYTEGLWALHASVDETSAIDVHLEALATKLWQHRDLLQGFRKRGYKIDICVGIFGIDDNMGFVLKSTLLRRVMQLGVVLDFDLYPSGGPGAFSPASPWVMGCDRATVVSSRLPMTLVNRPLPCSRILEELPLSVYRLRSV